MGIDLNNLSVEDLEAALAKKKQAEKADAIKKREAYEGIRAEMVYKIKGMVCDVCENVKGLFDFVTGETSAFKEVMAEYSQLKHPGQLSFKIEDSGFRVHVKSNKVKKFDERADVAAARLVEYLQEWIKDRNNGTDDPMYQLAMILLERNKEGDLEYKSISKLYDMETKFDDPNYSEIMQLFKESNVVSGTSTNYYFEQRDERGVWRKLEPSFNRL